MSAISDFIFANSNQDYFGSSSPFGDSRDVFIDGVVNQPRSGTPSAALVNTNFIGTQGNDYLAAYNFHPSEQDTLTGGAGADTFVAGNTTGIHYTGSAISFVTDYNYAQGDVIQLAAIGDGGYTYEFNNFGLGTEADDAVIYYNGDPIMALVDTSQFDWIF